MPVCELCQYYPATSRVTVVVEDGLRRDIAVCEVHKRTAERAAQATAGNRTIHRDASPQAGA